MCTQQLWRYVFTNFEDQCASRRLYAAASKAEKKAHYYAHSLNPTDSGFEQWLSRFETNGKNIKWGLAYESRQDAFRNFGVVSLTTCKSNYTMWSHYANSHTGFCVGLEPSFVKSVEDFFAYEKVNYPPEPPVFHAFRDDHIALNKALFFSKSKEWEYEDEMRLLTAGSGFKKFDRSKIREIVLGCRVAKPLENLARELIDSDIRVSKMADAISSYALSDEVLEHNVYF